MTDNNSSKLSRNKVDGGIPKILSNSLLAFLNSFEFTMRVRCGLTTKLSDRRRKRPVGCNSREQITQTVRLPSLSRRSF